MSDWKTKLEMIFGETDKIFAGHENDENRAFELLTLLRSEAIGWGELENATRDYLSDYDKGHIQVQIDKMRDSMGFWLLD